jgi:hypothetical protein
LCSFLVGYQLMKDRSPWNISHFFISSIIHLRL